MTSRHWLGKDSWRWLSLVDIQGGVQVLRVEEEVAKFSWAGAEFQVPGCSGGGDREGGDLGSEGQ